MTAAGALTDPDVTALRAEASTGRAVTVWFTPAAVGVPAGGSAKVVSVGDPADGDFIQVRPAGTRDTMFCSPNELTRTRPGRHREAPKPAAATKPRAARRAHPVAAGPAATEPPAAAVATPAAAAARTAAAAARTAAAAKPAAPAPAVPPPGVPAAKPGRPRRRSDPTGELSVSLTATADGEWTVEVRAGAKRIVAATPVPAAAVAAAARSWPAAVAEAVESSVEGARQRQRDRVEQLRAELEAAQQVLDQLGPDPRPR